MMSETWTFHFKSLEMFRPSIFILETTSIGIWFTKLGRSWGHYTPGSSVWLDYSNSVDDKPYVLVCSCELVEHWLNVYYIYINGLNFTLSNTYIHTLHERKQ